MGKTKRGSKGPGSEFWGKRPGNGGCPPTDGKCGKFAQKRTHRLERIEAKKEITREREDAK